MALSLIKQFSGTYERDWYSLLTDLETIEAAFNQRWAATFGDQNLIQLTQSVTGVLGVGHGGTGLDAVGAVNTILWSDGTVLSWRGDPILSTSLTLPLLIGSGAAGRLAVNNGVNTFPVGGPIADHYADVGNGTTVETDLYTDTLAASTFSANGDKVTATYAGVFVAHATATRDLRVYFGGTKIFDSTAVTVAAGSEPWEVRVTLIRVSASIVRASVTLAVTGAMGVTQTAYTAVTGLTLTNTQVLKITGQAGAAGAASNDIVAKLGTVRFDPAA